MSLLLVVHNDGSGTDDAANYNYRVMINAREIQRGRVEAHNRKHGWRELIHRVLEATSGEPDYDLPASTPTKDTAK